MIRALTWAIVAALASQGFAQERISPNSFLDIAVGKTLSFHLWPTGELVGVEEFLRRDLSVWRPDGGACVYGEITIQDGLLCFLYRDIQDQPVCWYTFEKGGSLMVRISDFSNGEVQEVLSITENSLNCPDPALS